MLVQCITCDKVSYQLIDNFILKFLLQLQHFSIFEFLFRAGRETFSFVDHIPIFSILGRSPPECG